MTKKKVTRSFRTGGQYRVTKTEEIPRWGYGDAERVFVVRFNNHLHGGRDSLEASSKAEQLARAVVCEDFDIPEDRQKDLFAIVGGLRHVTVTLRPHKERRIGA